MPPAAPRDGQPPAGQVDVVELDPEALHVGQARQRRASQRTALDPPPKGPPHARGGEQIRVLRRARQPDAGRVLHRARQLDARDGEEHLLLPTDQLPHTRREV